MHVCPVVQESSIEMLMRTSRVCVCARAQACVCMSFLSYRAVVQESSIEMLMRTSRVCVCVRAGTHACA